MDRPSVSVDADFLVIDHRRMNGLHPRAAALRSDARGASSRVQVGGGDPPDTPGAAERRIAYPVAISCEMDEQFTAHAGLEPEGSTGWRAPSGAVVHGVLVIGIGESPRYDLRQREVDPGDAGGSVEPVPDKDTLTTERQGLTLGSEYRLQVRSTKTDLSRASGARRPASPCRPPPRPRSR